MNCTRARPYAVALFLAGIVLVRPRLIGAQTPGAMVVSTPAQAPLSTVPSDQVLPPPLWATAAAPLVLRGVTVLDVEHGGRAPDQSLMIVGRRIRAVGPTAAIRLPSGAHVVDARGKYVMSGLWDMHLHPLQYTDIAYPLLIATGVTGVRDAGSNVPLATFNRWKQEIAAGTRVGPRLFVAGPSITDCPRNGELHHQICVTTPAEARLAVDMLKMAGADFIKTYVSTKELFFALASEAKRVGLPFGGHLPNGVDGLEASDSGARFLDHQTYFAGDPCRDWSSQSHPVPADSACRVAAARLRRNDTWVIPTVGLWVPPTVGPPRAAAIARAQEERRWRYFPPALLEGLGGKDRDSALAALGALPAAARAPATSTAEWRAVFFPDTGAAGADTAASRPPLGGLGGFGFKVAAGLPMVAATDAVLGPTWYWGVPGFTLQEALEHLVLSGASPAAALQMAALNPARALHATDSLGTVATDKLADLVLLDADPFQDIWNITRIRAVVADGHYYDRAALDQLLAEAARAARR